MADEKLWAKLPPLSKEFAQATLKRFKADQEKVRSSLLYERVRRSWQLYNARGQGGLCDDTQLNFQGEQGEIVALSSRRYRRLIQDQVGLVQQTPPDYQPEAINTDPESQAQCALSLGILDQYKRRSHLEDVHIERAEMALVMSVSYLHVRWDPDAGDVARVEDEEAAEPPSDPDAQMEAMESPGQDVALPGTRAPKQREVFEGDLSFGVRSMFEVAHDRTSPDRRKPRWWIVQEPINRYDLLEMFGNELRADAEGLRKAIEGAPKWSSFIKEWGFDKVEDDYDESIAVYWVYYERCKALPEGRRALVLNEEFTLLDGPLDEDQAGVFRLSPSDVLMRSEGHTNAFDGMGIVQAITSQGTIIQSNHDAFGLQRVLSPRRANIDQHKLATGLAAVDYDDVDATGQTIEKPSMMNLLQSQPEMLQWLQMLHAELDTVIGGSPVSRGDPEATKGDSGSKAAMLFAAAQNVGSGFVKNCLNSASDVATFIIGSMRRHATEERITSIVGKNSTYTAKRFKGEDLSRISRVNVRQANPARDTFQGRMALAELLADKTPEQQQQIIALVNTGRIEPLTEETETGRLLIERENDALRDPKQPVPPTVDSDQHREHALKHMQCKNDPTIRGNPALAQRHDQHIADHIKRLTPDDPLFAGVPVLMLTGQQPLPSHAEIAMQLAAGASGQSAAAPQAGPPSGAKPPAPAGNSKPPGIAKPEEGKAPNMPQMPITPSTGERVNLPVPEGPMLG